MLIKTEPSSNVITSIVFVPDDFSGYNEKPSATQKQKALELIQRYHLRSVDGTFPASYNPRNSYALSVLMEAFYDMPSGCFDLIQLFGNTVEEGLRNLEYVKQLASSEENNIEEIKRNFSKLYVFVKAIQLTSISYLSDNDNLVSSLVASANKGTPHPGVKHLADRNQQCYVVIEMVDEHIQRFSKFTR